MRIEKLKLINFRNYPSLEISFHPGINIFIGENGQGKTNILESIYILSLSKSNRSGMEENLIKFDEEIAKVEGMIRKDGLLKKQEVHISKIKKQLFINNKEIKRSRDYISNFCVIAFTPDDLDIVKGSPIIRRNMMNIDISQLHNSYITYLNEYNLVVKMRNEYLRKMNLNGNTDIRYLEILNENLIEKACKIYEFRYLFVEKINKFLPNIFKKITSLVNLQISYNNSIGIEKYDYNEIRRKFGAKFKKNFNMELMQGMTMVGPHRDDFFFNLDGKDMKLFASQGQQRMAVIALKIAEIYLFKEELGEYPVLLLDDIFSEIDAKKRNKIIKYLNYNIQCIITTTDLNDIDENLLENSFIYNVKNKKVTRKGMIKNGRRESNN